MAKTNNVARLTTTSSPALSKSPDSDVSPGTKVPSPPADYFSTSGVNGHLKSNGARPAFVAASTGASTTTTLTSISEEFHLDSSRQSSNDSGRPSDGRRKSSTASVTFRSPRNPSLPQGNPRKTDNRRLRESSPSPVR
jgi:hypothetical protein